MRGSGLRAYSIEGKGMVVMIHRERKGRTEGRCDRYALHQA